MGGRRKYCDKHIYPIVMKRLLIFVSKEVGFKGIAWFCPVCREIIFDDEKSRKINDK